MDTIIQFFSRQMKLDPHFREQICIILFDTVTQERVDSGNFTINAKEKNPVMGNPLFEPFFKKCG